MKSFDKKKNKYHGKESRSIVLEQKKAAWKESEEELTKEKEAIGYGKHSIPEFLGLSPGANMGQAEMSRFLTLQFSLQELQKQRQLLWAEEDVVEELNKKHAVIHIDQFYILTEKVNPVLGGMDFSLENKQSFKNLYENKFIKCPDGCVATKAELWLKSPHRREYKGIVFSPHGTTDPGFYNLWRGFAKQPKQGDCSKYWEHVRDNICSGDLVSYQFLRKWLAYVFQRPDEVHTAIVLCGSQGVGKNSFVEPLGVLLGSHYVLLCSLNELVSNFNYHLKYAVLIHANEALWGGHKKDLGTLKAMITEKICLIEGKGKDRVMLGNFKHVVISSNEDWPVHLDADDRRFYVLKVSDAHKEDHRYFATIQEQLNDGGYEALLYDLLNEDLAGFNPRIFPQSPDAFAIKIQSAHSVERYIYDVLNEGRFDVGNVTPNAPWQDEVAKACIFHDYCTWCANNKEIQVGKDIFCRKLKAILKSVSDFRPRLSEDSSLRVSKYKLAPIHELRKEFQEYYKADDSIWSE